jgi:CRISPR/Cas system-associated protein Csm6
MAKVLLTMMGRSVWGLFNSVWASIRQFDYLPDKVYVMTAGCDASRGQMAKEMLNVLLREHGSRGEVEMVDVPGDDIKEIGSRVNEIIGAENAKGNEVAVDVTPGTKATVLGTVIGAGKVKVDHIFYLYIESLRNAARPYLEIPLDLQHSHDLLKEVR